MNNIKFLLTMQQWDLWERPYNVVDRCFYLFDTGEIVFTRTSMCVDERTHYSDIGLSICNSGEIGDYIDSPMATPEGVKVAKAHIVFTATGETQQQLLIIDEDKREIYNVSSAGSIPTRKLPGVPEAIEERGTIYWASYKHRPVCFPVRIVSPRKLTPEQKERKEEAELLCKSAAALKSLVPRHTHPFNVSTKVHTAAPDKIYDTKVPLVDIVSEMNDSEVAFIASNGMPTKKTSSAPYLKF